MQHLSSTSPCSDTQDQSAAVCSNNSCSILVYHGRHNHSVRQAAFMPVPDPQKSYSYAMPQGVNNKQRSAYNGSCSVEKGLMYGE